MDVSFAHSLATDSDYLRELVVFRSKFAIAM
jgi:hypothetical protein